MIIFVTAAPTEKKTAKPLPSPKRKKPYTIEDLDDIQQKTGKNFHLINGDLIEIMPAGTYHGKIASKIDRVIGAFVDEHDLGDTYAAETGFKLPQPNTVIGPDFAFISKKRLPSDITKKGYGEVVPDFVVEVKSPRDSMREMLKKAALWLDAGVQLVWIVHPEKQTITTYNADDDIKQFSKTDIITGETILSGFRTEVKKFFE